jgi:carbohydrate-selective porin OprB
MSDKSERVVELSYRMPVTDSIVITPDVQFVTNPSFTAGASDSLIFYLRTEVGL